MKKILLSLSFVVYGAMAIAQSVNQTHPANTGNFNVIQNTSKGEEHINVNYSFSPVTLMNELNLQLSTPDPMILSAKVLNSNSETVLNWTPSKSNIYNQKFDISNLPAGNYHIEIYGPDSKKVKDILFTKQANTTSTSATTR